ncbi:DUF2933 domain-containing protein [Streptomyces himalayensis]|uniref:DUF2933 domain-containing protein n=1 Tax=Streptomyces himalayensis TaxID=2820085 RepID=UPI001C67386F|nr:DUF2933 domain-containing protein [Streptomyces himalayensis]
MNIGKRNYGLLAIALAIVLVGALALGLPLSTLVLLGIVLLCPLMMFFMMRGMHDGSGQDTDQADRPRFHDHHTGPRRPWRARPR